LSTFLPRALRGIVQGGPEAVAHEPVEHRRTSLCPDDARPTARDPAGVRLARSAYEYEVPPDTEFPYLVPKFDLFLRVIARSAGIVGYRFRVRRRMGRGQWDAPTEYNSPANVLVFPTNRTVVFSHSFRLPNVRLTGTGLHAVTVYFRPRRSRWRLAAVEYFRVVR